jgi:hypothetical protein
METLESHKLPFAKDHLETHDLLECVKVGLIFLALGF